MNKFRVKNILSRITDGIGLNRFFLRLLNKKYNNDYIRVINYHNTLQRDLTSFEKQLLWFSKNYYNVDYSKLRDFFDGKIHFLEKPGLIITFDDGFVDNYNYAKALLEKYNFTGYFMVSSDLVGEEGYMNSGQLIQLAKDNHVIGSHTATHHRMRNDDTEDVLYKEVTSSKKKIESIIDLPVDIFCWCGGEEEHYTAGAAKAIYKAGYKFALLTNSLPLTHDTDPLLIERTNIEASWGLSLVRFQLCGIIDKKFKAKRERVEKIITESKI